MKGIVLAILLSLLVHVNCSITYANGSVNLLRNPGFEEIGTWKTFTADANDIADSRNANQSHSGKYSAYARATTIGGDGYAFVYQNVSIPIVSSLEFSFWLYVRHPEFPFQGYIKGFVTTSGSRYFDLGIWSDVPKPRPSEYILQTRLETYDTWFRISVDLGRLWIDEASFPGDDTITTVSFGIYNGLVYALPKNLLYLEVFFDDVFLGSSTPREEPRFPWLVAISCLIGVTMIVTAVLARRRSLVRIPPTSHEGFTSRIPKRAIRTERLESVVYYRP